MLENTNSASALESELVSRKSPQEFSATVPVAINANANILFFIDVISFCLECYVKTEGESPRFRIGAEIVVRCWETAVTAVGIGADVDVGVKTAVAFEAEEVARGEIESCPADTDALCELRRECISHCDGLQAEIRSIFYELGIDDTILRERQCVLGSCIKRAERRRLGDGKEIAAAISTRDLSRYSEVVFCGFGEPTERLDVLLRTADYIKSLSPDMKIRINTNGLGDLIHGKPIAPQLTGRIDVVSISLNTPNAQEYLRLTRSKFGEQSFDAMLRFARDCVSAVHEVVMTTVSTTITHEEEEQCRAICAQIGARYRIRPWED